MKRPRGYDTVTVWRKSNDGSFERGLLLDVHVELAEGADTAPVGPKPSHALSVISFSDPLLSPGDFVLWGRSHEALPPAHAHRVRSVAPWRFMGRAHHWKVEA